MTALLDLADRCRNAEGPSRELDCLIAEAFGWTDCKGAGYGTWTGLKPGASKRQNIMAFTRSVDAALTLVPDDWRLSGLYEADPSNTVDGKVQYATLKRRSGDGHHIISVGMTIALALCSAVFRARAAL